MLKTAFGSTRYVGGGSATAGFSLPVPAAGVFLRYWSFCCWTLPPGGSCTLLLSRDLASWLCCGALLLKIILNLNSIPPRQKKTPNQPQKSHYPWYSCFLSAFLNKASSALGREGSFNCRIYEKQPSHYIKHNSETFFHP